MRAVLICTSGAICVSVPLAQQQRQHPCPCNSSGAHGSAPAAPMALQQQQRPRLWNGGSAHGSTTAAAPMALLDRLLASTYRCQTYETGSTRPKGSLTDSSDKDIIRAKVKNL